MVGPRLLRPRATPPRGGPDRRVPPRGAPSRNRPGIAPSSRLWPVHGRGGRRPGVRREDISNRREYPPRRFETLRHRPARRLIARSDRTCRAGKLHRGALRSRPARLPRFESEVLRVSRAERLPGPFRRNHRAVSETTETARHARDVAGCGGDRAPRPLFLRKKAAGWLAGLWEFPSAEAPTRTDARRLLGTILPDAGRPVARIHHVIVGRRFRIDVYRARASRGPKRDGRWMTRDEIDRAAVSTLTRKILRSLAPGAARA